MKYIDKSALSNNLPQRSVDLQAEQPGACHVRHRDPLRPCDPVDPPGQPSGCRGRPARPLFAYPSWAGHWPAVAGFFALAWVELIYPAPADPAVLARLVASYLLFQLAGVLAFGERWLRDAEPFSVFFRTVSWLAPVGAACAGIWTWG